MRLLVSIVALVGLSGLLIVPEAGHGGPGHHACTDPNYTTSADQGRVSYGSEVVSQDVWNPASISQTLSACAGNSWKVKATVNNEGGAVQSYPDTNVTTPATELSSFSTLTSNFRLTDPPTGAGLSYEGAFDIWLGDENEWADASSHTEMMIWNYTVGSRAPAGSQVGTTTLDGHTFSVWLAGGIGQSNGDIVSFEATTNYEAAHTNLLPFFTYAAGQGWLEAGINTYLWQVDYGLELVATPKGTVFNLEAFNIVGNGKELT